MGGSLRARWIALIHLFAFISGGFCYGNLKCAVGPNKECLFNEIYGSDIQNIDDVNVEKGVFENTPVGYAILEGPSVDYMPVIFKKIPELMQLFVKNYQTITFKEEIFENAGITHFIASNNLKLAIEDNAFRKAKKLKYLNLNANGIESIPKDAFNGLNSLTELYLGNIKIKRLKDHTFRGAPNLERLILTENPIRSVRRNTFAGLRNLKMLDLRSSPIEEIENGFLLDLPGNLEINFDPSSCIKASNLKIKVGGISNELDKCYMNYRENHHGDESTLTPWTETSTDSSTSSSIKTSTGILTTTWIEPTIKPSPIWSNFNYFYIFLILIFIRLMIFAIFVFWKM